MTDETIHYLFTAITRFGTISIVIYGVGVLLNVFKYVMRLAAYYEARAHATAIAFQLGELNAEKIGKFVAAFDGEKVEFGSEPPAPIESAISVIKAAGEAVRSASEVVKK